jgi:hypothetical protein
MSISRNIPPWKWTKPKEEAAVLLAEDELTDEEIAAQVGITSRQMRVWKSRLEFVERIESLSRHMADPALRHAIARKARRIRDYEDRRRRMLSVIDERASQPEMTTVPGGQSGLLCHTVKSIGGGDNAQVVDEYEVDTGLLKELRELEKQAAMELGQWKEGMEVSGAVQIKVIEDGNWYGNGVCYNAAQGLAASGSGAALAIPIQGGGVRPTLGQNGVGSSGDGEGPRSP